MTESSLFYQKLKKDFPDLLELIQKNNFVILEPKRNLIELKFGNSQREKKEK